MDPRCERVIEELVRSGGRVDALADDLKDHVAVCRTCREVARAERELAKAFDMLSYQAGVVSVPELIAQLPVQARHLPSWVPVSLAGVVVVAAFASLGGFPAAAITGVLPAVTGQTGIDLVDHVASQIMLVPQILRALSQLVPAGYRIGAAVTSVGTFVMLVRAVVHLRRRFD